MILLKLQTGTYYGYAKLTINPKDAPDINMFHVRKETFGFDCYDCEGF